MHMNAYGIICSWSPVHLCLDGVRLGQFWLGGLGRLGWILWAFHRVDLPGLCKVLPNTPHASHHYVRLDAWVRLEDMAFCPTTRAACKMDVIS